MRILVVSSVPPSTRIPPDHPRVRALLKLAGLQTPTVDLGKEAEYVEALRPYYVRRAREMFSGYFKHVLRFVNSLRALGHRVDLLILSPRYGLIGEDHPVIPHTASLRGLSASSVRELANNLKTYDKLLSVLKLGNYDILLLVLNREDLRLLHDPRAGRDLSLAAKWWRRAIVISAESIKKTVSQLPNLSFLAARNIGERLSNLQQYLNELTQLKLAT